MPVTASDAQTYMRIASASIGFFDYVMTLPSEYRLWRRQKNILRPSTGFVLFMLCRYLGLIALILATYFFFATTFTTESCDKVVSLGGIFRVLTSEAAALVLFWRTRAIWNKSQIVTIGMLVIMLPVTVVSFASIAHQTGVSVGGNCTGHAGQDLLDQKWPFSAANLFFDAVACGVSSFKLIQNARSGTSPISKILLHDGMLYFAVMILGHSLNLYFFTRKDPALQGMTQLFNVTLTMVLSQRIITALSERILDSPSSNHQTTSRIGTRSRSRSGSHFPKPRQWRASQIGVSGREPATDVDSALELGIKVEVDVHVDGEHSPGSTPMAIVPSTRFELASKSDDGHGDHKAY